MKLTLRPPSHTEICQSCLENVNRIAQLEDELKAMKSESVNSRVGITTNPLIKLLINTGLRGSDEHTLLEELESKCQQIELLKELYQESYRINCELQSHIRQLIEERK